MKIVNRFKRMSRSEIAVHLIVSVIFMAVAISYLYLLIWSFIAGFRTHNEIVLDPFGLPTTWNWKNYLDVFHLLEVNGKRFPEMFFNSVFFSVVGVLLQQGVTIVFAYCCSKYKFPGSQLMYTIILIAMTLPIYGASGATYKLYHNLGLIDSYVQVIVGAAGFNVYFLYYTSFFKNLSWAYAEAAMMDGADDFQICYKVMLPQVKPIFGALFLTSWLPQWNSFEGQLAYLPSLPTLPVGIYQFNTEMIYRARLDILFAACVLVSIPALLLFIGFNKIITTSVSVGGLKG